MIKSLLSIAAAFCFLPVILAGEKEAVLNDNYVHTVPPPGIAPFAPAPLMEKLRQRVTTDKFRFAVLGDAKHSTALPGLLKFLDEQINPDFVLTTGDMVAVGAGKVGPGYYEMLTNEAGPAMRKRPWWPAVGNHELNGGPSKPKEMKNLDGEALRESQQAGIDNFKKFYQLENDFYSFEFRNARFIALPFRQPFGKQIEWLESELKAGIEKKQHIFVFNHEPYFTIGHKPESEIPNRETEITALFRKYGVKAVFSGHDHSYYRTVRSGIPYFISAGGGAAIYPGTRTAEALPEDVYYVGEAKSFEGVSTQHKFLLHKTDGSERITDKQDQFICVIDVDGAKANCYCITAKGEKWDEIQLSK